MAASTSTAVVPLAPRIFLHAPGTDVPAPPGSITLPTLPSTAFGDGSHPTTRLCARAVDHWCRHHSNAAVLDVGTGTGVLARIARAHGAIRVVGTDVDPRALDAARANAALDPTGCNLLITNQPPDAWGPSFNLVVANILEEVLLGLADALIGALAPGGALILSGFTRVQGPALKIAFTARGLVPDMQVDLEGWTLLQLKRPDDGLR